MTYKESYLACKGKEEFKRMVSNDVTFALIFNKERLKYIEDAVNEVCKIHPSWSDAAVEILER
jgi:hypothetical protein